MPFSKLSSFAVSSLTFVSRSSLAVVAYELATGPLGRSLGMGLELFVWNLSKSVHSCSAAHAALTRSSKEDMTSYLCWIACFTVALVRPFQNTTLSVSSRACGEMPPICSALFIANCSLVL